MKMIGCIHSIVSGISWSSLKGSVMARIPLTNAVAVS